MGLQYEPMHFPGERVQIDVKFVPEVCIVGDAKGGKFYQLLQSTSFPVGGIWKPFSNTVLILLLPLHNTLLTGLQKSAHWYGIVDETHEEYTYPLELFEIISE